MKAVAAGGEDAAEQIARLLREGRAAEVTDEMLGALTPNDQAKLFELYESGATGMDLPMDADNRMYRANRIGFPVHKMDGLSYHITPNDISSFKLNADPSSHSEGGAVWTRLNPRTNPAAHQVSTAQKVFAEGANDMPLYGRGNELSPMRSHDFELSDAFPYALSMGENQKLREAGYGIYERGNERLIFDPANIRSRNARFDPRLSKNADLLASRAAPGGVGDYSTQEARAAPRGVMAIPMRPSSPSMPSGAGPSLSDALGRAAQAFGTAGRAGIEGMATALSGVDEQGRSVGSILPFAKDERTGEVGLASPRILDLWNTAGGVVPARGVTLGAGPVMRGADSALDMSQEARMARAREMGFDVENPVYHGTPYDFESFAGGAGTRRGIYATPDPAIADIYANAVDRHRFIGSAAPNAGPNVIPAYLRGPVLEISDLGPDGSHGWSSDNLAAALGIDAEKFPAGRRAREIDRIARERGYGAIRITDMLDLGGEQSQYRVLDPANIRSVHAAFDPAKRDSADLLASRAAPGSLGIGGERRLTYRDVEDWL